MSNSQHPTTNNQYQHKPKKFHVKQNKGIARTANKEKPGLLFEQELLNACPLCGSEGERKIVLSAQDYLVSEEVFHVEQCPSCDLQYTNPRPKPLKIRDYYLSEAYISHAGEARSPLEWAYQLVRRLMIQKKIRLLRRYIKPGGEVMDIGCGTGAFLEVLQSKGYKVRGYEPQESARKIAQNKNLNVSGKDDSLKDLPDQCLDGITLWHVLEHIHELGSNLELYRRLLVPGGFLIIAVPVHSAFDAGFYGEGWAAYDLPRHLYHFNRKTLQNALGTRGFRLLSRKGLPFDSLYVSLLSEKQMGKLPVGLRQARALTIGMISNLYAMSRQKPWSSEMFVFQKGKLA